MTIEELEKRVIELEAEVARLRVAATIPQTIYHYHSWPPNYGGQPYYHPVPWYPNYPQVWCGGAGVQGALGAGAGG